MLSLRRLRISCVAEVEDVVEVEEHALLTGSVSGQQQQEREGQGVGGFGVVGRIGHRIM
jgi:hypothetical protein